MRSRTAIATLAVTSILGLAFAAGRLSLAGDEKEKKEFQPPKPGTEHQALKQFEGKWEGKSTFRMAADAPEQEGAMTEENRFGLGGFWLISDVKGGSEEMGPFEGHGILGYDTYKKKYVGVWTDSMSTYLFPYEGTYDQGTKTWTYTGVMKDMEGKDLKVVMKSTIKDRDHYTFIVRHPDPSGKDMEAFRIEYTRKK